MPDEKQLQAIKQLLDTAENHIRQARGLLFTAELSRKVDHMDLAVDGEVVEGVFDGEKMIGPKKKIYPVPANYASKSKLVPGDVLKLTVAADGSFLFKQIGPVRRKKLIADLEEVSEGEFQANVQGKKYRLLLASVTFFRARPADKLVIIVPEKEESEWAAIENLLEGIN